MRPLSLFAVAGLTEDSTLPTIPELLRRVSQASRKDPTCLYKKSLQQHVVPQEYWSSVFPPELFETGPSSHLGNPLSRYIKYYNIIVS
jgi:hypothetical protein